MGKGKRGKKKKLDDLAAVRDVVDALQTFDSDVRERILRWATEKLDLLSNAARGAHSKAKKRSKANKRARPAKKTAGKKAARKKKTRGR